MPSFRYLTKCMRTEKQGLNSIIWLSGSKRGIAGYENTLCNIALWLTDKQAYTQIPESTKHLQMY